jgi:hypothetical protein
MKKFLAFESEKPQNDLTGSRTGQDETGISRKPLKMGALEMEKITTAISKTVKGAWRSQ